MYLGNRRVRSAGRTSGSIEITLPAELQMLEGITCRLMVRDGSRPELVLQPDLTEAGALFGELWGRLRLGLSAIDEIGDFSAGDFTLALFPPNHWRERPPLAYADALTVLRQRQTHVAGDSEALTRLLAFLAVGAARRLALEGALAQAFGDAVAYLITGRSAGLGADFERGMAHRLFWGEGSAEPASSTPFDAHVWQAAQPGLRRVYEQFQDWQRQPADYASARDNWYRALTLEVGGWLTPARASAAHSQTAVMTELAVARQM